MPETQDGLRHEAHRQWAQAADLGRESLYKALRACAHPRLDITQRVCAALEVTLVTVPATQQSQVNLPPTKRTKSGNQAYRLPGETPALS
jgi:hypothetical protein